jgi:hypothetical protein
MTNAQLHAAILSLPPDLKRQVENFIEFLLSKPGGQFRKRQLGCAKGLIEIAPDFDDPLSDFKEFM